MGYRYFECSKCRWEGPEEELVVLRATKEEQGTRNRCPKCTNETYSFRELREQLNEWKFKERQLQAVLKKAQLEVIEEKTNRQKAESQLCKAHSKLKRFDILKSQVDELEQLSEKSYCVLHGTHPADGEPCWACIQSVLGSEEKQKLLEEPKRNDGYVLAK